MAAFCCYCAWSMLALMLVQLLAISGNENEQPPMTDKKEGGEVLYSSGIVHFNNPKLLMEAESSDAEDARGVYDTTQETVDPRKIGGIYIKTEARRLGSKLRMLSNQEISVTAMQGIFDSLPFEEFKPDLGKELSKLAEETRTKINKYLQLLLTTKITVENLYTPDRPPSLGHRRDCCVLPTSSLRWDTDYQLYISQKVTCDLVPPRTSSGAFNPGRNLTEVFQLNVQLFPAIKWQYFMSVDGVHNEFPAHNFRDMPYAECRNIQDVRHRELFVQTISPKRKNVILLVDHGNSLSANQLDTAKAIARHILQSLSENDRVGVVGLSDTVRFAREDHCLTRHLVPLTNEARQYFTAFIDDLTKQKAATNHSLGFQQAMMMIRNTLAPNDTVMPTEDALIIYVSRGLLSSLTDARHVLNTIAVENGHLGNKVIINTYAVIDDGKPIMYEKRFLQDIADQNFTKYLVNATHPSPIRRGTMTAVNTTHDISTSVGNFFKVFNRTTPNRPHISLPFKDQFGKGLVVAVTWPCFYHKELIGVVGLDIYAGHLLEGVTYFQKPDKSSYAFIIDKKGYTVMHPHLSRPIVSDSQPLYADISRFEYYKGFNKIRAMMLTYDEGEQSIEVLRNPGNTSHPNELLMLPHFLTVQYRWRNVKIPKMHGEAPFIVVIRTIEDGFKLRDMTHMNAESSTPPLVYHRLDLLPTVNTCMHLKQLATLESSALFLSANSFKSPFEHLSEEETKRSVHGYLAYLSDNTKLIANPGIRDDIRNDVAALSRINRAWVKQFHVSRLNDFIIRRYVATPRGVFTMFPGSLLHKNYDPSKREWYTRAMEYPGKVTLTAPYLDKGGAGYIVTVSHTIYEGKNAALHGPFDRVVAVMGMDMTLGYFYRLVIEQLPVCERQHMRCFIMDDRGYLIAHQGLIEPNGRGPVEQQHITRKEPLVANDILNHRGFIRKQLCNSYTDRTIQRFYHFNTSVDRILTNLVHGEHCSKYQVTPIPGTNAFLGVVNNTCSVMRAFCPCSMVDRLCLNCHRMEQTECECPCECPLDLDFCSGELLEKEDENPSCMAFPEETILVVVDPKLSKSLPKCFHTVCNSRGTKRACLGVLDCEWCVLDSDGETPLTDPFCSTQRVCFAGVLGAHTPYHDEIKAAVREAEAVTLKSTPVGPVAGGIMGCFLVLALGVYCYRHHVHRTSHHYIASLPDNNMRMNQLDNDLEEPEHTEEPGSGHTNIVLATFDNPAASISPYRVNTTYRRPTTGDSDHGYSTMTPHDDSEQASTTCVEPLIIGRDRYRPAPHTVLKTTPMLPPPPGHNRRSRSPTPPHTQVPKHASIPEQSTLLQGQTVIPEPANPHHVIANVQVHMVDTH